MRSRTSGLGGAYAGNPLAVATAQAVLDVLKDEICANTYAVYLGQRLSLLHDACPAIADARGLESMAAVELNDPTTGKPDTTAVKRMQGQALEHGLVPRTVASTTMCRAFWIH